MSFTAVVLLAFVYFALTANGFSHLARVFPFNVAITGVIFTSFLLGWQLLRWGLGIVDQDTEPDGDTYVVADSGEPGPLRVLRAFGWIGVFFALIWLLGMLVASAVFVVAYLLVESPLKPLRVAGMAAIAVIFIVLLNSQLDLLLPTGLELY